MFRSLFLHEIITYMYTHKTNTMGTVGHDLVWDTWERSADLQRSGAKRIFGRNGRVPGHR